MEETPTPKGLAIGTGIAAKAIDAGMGLITTPIAMKMQENANRRLADQNQRLALEMWEKTNYSAQRRQMEKAGLNIGLMYKGAGEGGQIQQGTAQGVNAMPLTGMGLEYGLQHQRTQAEIDLIEAQAENVRTDTKKKAGVDTDKALTEMAKIAEETNNIQIKNTIADIERQMAEIDLRIKSNTTEEEISIIKNELSKIMGDAESALVKGRVDKATEDKLVQAVKLGVQEQQARIDMLRKGLVKADTEIANLKEATNKITSEIALNYQQKFINWEKLNLQERETLVKETLAKATTAQVEFNTSTPEQIKQWLSIFTDLIKMAPTPAKAPIGFK